MKKLVKLLTVFVLCLSVSGCGGNDSKPANDGENQNPVANTTKPNEINKEENGTFKSELLVNTYQVPMQEVYIDLPNYQFIKQGYTAISIVHDLKYTAFVASYDHKAENAKDAFKCVFEDFKIDLQNYNGGPFKMDIENDRVETINGIETYYFEGMMSYCEDANNPWQCYSVGYTFVFDDTPFGIFGSVIDESQPEDVKKEIKQVVMDMMKTVRDKE